MSDTLDLDPGATGVASFLATVPLFTGVPAEQLEYLGRVLRPLELAPGDALWRDGEQADGLHLIRDGLVRVSKRLPAGRELEIATLGPGEMLGEIPLLDGGTRSATVRAVEQTTVLLLSQPDFGALVARQDPVAFTVKRRIARIACERLRPMHAALAASLGGGDPAPTHPASAGGDAAPDAARPAPGYLRRLPAFRAFDTAALEELLGVAHFELFARGHTFVAEGDVSGACRITINGAVEEVIERGHRRIRVGLAGPGRAFGYADLIDGGPSSLSAVARERTLALVVSSEPFERLFNGVTAGSHAFLEAVQRDLMAALRQAQRPQARLAALAPHA